MNIVKLGGSLLDMAADIIEIIKINNPLIIPGGGTFADKIRNFDEKMHLSDETAHKMAICAMNQYGLYLSDVSGIKCSNSPMEGTSILLPYDIMSQYNLLPYSWEVTSDSIACFIAKLCNQKEFVLLKRVNGISYNGKVLKQVKASEVIKIEQYVVDSYLCRSLNEYEIDCYIYDVSNVDTFRENYVLGKYSTKIVHN